MLLVAALAVTGYGAGGYVFFHKTVGDWVVLCSGASQSAKRTCLLSAPPPKLSTAAPQNLIVVSEPSTDTFEVALQIRDLAMAGLPAFIRAEGFKVHEAPVRDGRAVWHGQVALKIIAEMRTARSVVFRVQTMPDGMPRDTRVSLAGFRQALSAYRNTIRAHGLLSAR